MTTPTYEPEGTLTDAEVLGAFTSLEGWREVASAGQVDRVDGAFVERLAASVPWSPAPSVLRSTREAVHRRRRRRRWAIGAVTAGLVAAVTAAVVVLPTLGDAPPQRAEAAVLLDLAAAAVTPDPPARDNQWWRVVSSMNGVGIANGEQTSPQRIFRIAETVTRYRSADGRSPLYQLSSPRVFLSQLSGPTGPLPAALPGSALVGMPTDSAENPWASPTAAWLAGLPRDASALREALSRYSDDRPGGDARTAFTHTVSLLQSGLAPADLRAAILRALGGYGGELAVVPGVTIGGRTGVAVSDTDTEPRDPTSRAVTPEIGLVQQLVVDPTRGDLLGYRTITVGDTGFGVPSGTVVAEIVVTRTLVDDVPEALVSRATPAPLP